MDRFKEPDQYSEQYEADYEQAWDDFCSLCADEALKRLPLPGFAEALQAWMEEHGDKVWRDSPILDLADMVGYDLDSAFENSFVIEREDGVC